MATDTGESFGGRTSAAHVRFHLVKVSELPGKMTPADHIAALSEVFHRVRLLEYPGTQAQYGEWQGIKARTNGPGQVDLVDLEEKIAAILADYSVNRSALSGTPFLVAMQDFNTHLQEGYSIQNGVEICEADLALVLAGGQAWREASTVGANTLTLAVQLRLQLFTNLATYD